MNCYCNSKELYRHQQGEFIIDGKSHLNKRKYITKHLSQHRRVVWQSSQTYIPLQIPTIQWQQLEHTKFYEEFIYKNVPCIIKNAIDGHQILQNMANPHDVASIINQQVSISLTPDGYADSIRGQYFIQPYQIKSPIKTFFDQQSYTNAIKYIQHQNNNLMDQMPQLACHFPKQILKTISTRLYHGMQPQSQNIWLGYNQSVSSLHKDPYENYYMTLCGEKHFTLTPPISIMNLPQGNFLHAKWYYNQNNFEAKSIAKQLQSTHIKWISANIDLKDDYAMYQGLNQIPKYHIILNKGQILYLPSLWYHQVSQCSRKDPYIMAINYWFNMNFNPNYTLYNICANL